MTSFYELGTEQEAIAAELGDEEIARRIAKLPSYNRTTSVITVDATVKLTAKVLRAIGELADAIGGNLTWENRSLDRPLTLDELGRAVIWQEYWTRQAAKRKAEQEGK